jgi:alpha,alpha-trehalase
LRAPADQVAAAYRRLKASRRQSIGGGISRNDLRSFVDEWFDPCESDLIQPYSCTASPLPPPPPGWLPRVTHPEIRAWADELHGKWAKLCRAAHPDVALNPQNYTMLPVPGPFIVPGSRFREGYYWDSYWAVLGLLISGLVDLAKAIVENLVHCVNTYGFVPNGLRCYYLNRSQPPLLAAMIHAIWQKTEDIEFVRHMFPALQAELEWWQSDVHAVPVERVVNGDKMITSLARYNAQTDHPRLESLKEDLQTCQAFESDCDAGADLKDRTKLFRDIASAAESGWDFSTRWFANGKDLGTIRTTNVLPADLNALLYHAECLTATLAGLIGDVEASQKYRDCADKRLGAINAVHWDDDGGRWRDCVIDNGSPVSPTCTAYASDWVPLWCGCACKESGKAMAALASLEQAFKLSTECPGGIPASTCNFSGEQWDFPNVWPPMQYFLIEGIEKYCGSKGKQVAEEMAKRFLVTAFEAWKQTGLMFEKFDARVVGVAGGGGEYSVADGFGWTNGLVLVWLEKYGWDS